MKNKYFYILILLLFSVFWIWWMPGPRVALDFSFIAQDWIKLLFDLPLTWNERGAEGLGEYGIFLLWSWPVSFIFGFLANLGMTFEIWERILIILFITFGSISIWKFLSSFHLSSRAKIIGSVFYLLNTYSILLIDGGQIFISIAYSLFPLTCLFVYESVYSNLTKKIFTGLTVSLMGFFDVRFIYLLFLLFLFRAIFERKQIWQWFSTGLVIGLIVLGLNSYWIIMLFKFPLEYTIFTSFTEASTSFVNIGHSLLMIAPHWYKNIFGKVSPLRIEFILIPLLVFLSPIIRRKDKQVLFWLSISLISVFLAKGASEPLPNIYPWLHANIPGFVFFRDSTKFFFLVALSYSVLISITSEELMKKLSNFKKLDYYFFVFILSFLLYIINPVLLNKMTGTFSISPVEKEFQSLSNVLKNDSTFGRILWIPATAPLSYFDLNHPVMEPIRIFNRIPFTFGVKGAYEIFNFLREASYMGEIFDVAGIEYIAYPYFDLRRDSVSSDDIKYYHTFLDQLTNLPWIEKRIKESKVPLLKTKNHQDKIFLTNNTIIAFGSDEIFNDATKSAEFKLSKNAIILAEYKPELGNLINRYPEAKIVLNKKTVTDLIASYFPESVIIFPAKQLSTSPNKEGWWKNNGTDLIAWRDFLQTKYNIDSKEFDLGGGWAVSEGNLKLVVKNENLQKDNVLFTRVLESSRSGRISFYQGEELIGSVNTKEDKEAIVRWFEIGLLLSSQELVIKTEGDFNIINALVSIDQKELADYKNKAQNLETQAAYFEPTIATGNAKMDFKKIGQTRYKVSVSNLPSPQTLVFSSSFHPMWKLNGEASIPVYGFLNGFRIEKDGEYILEFEAQRYIWIGLLVSGVTIFILLGLLIYRYYNPRVRIMK